MATKSIWSDLPRRAATICIGFPLVWKILSSKALAKLFFVCVHFLVTWEYSQLEPKTNSQPPLSSRLTFCVISLLLAHIPSYSLFQLSICCTVGIWTILQRQHWTLGLFVVTIPFRTWYYISQDFVSTISILLVVWNCDTGALLLGRLSSKTGIRRLSVPLWIQKISPAKSMEGFIGGIIGGTWTAVSLIPRLVTWFELETSESFDFLWNTTIINRLLLGIALSILAIFGDLVESCIKRQSQTKDSGSVLPGHGGILDRFDSSLISILLYSFLLEYSMVHSPEG